MGVSLINVEPKFGTWMKLELPYSQANESTTSLPSRARGNKEVTTVIAAVNADGGMSLIDMVEILLDIMLMDVLINGVHLLLLCDTNHILTANCSWNKVIKYCTFIT